MIFLSLFVVSTFDLHKIIFLLNIRIVFILENFKTLLVVLLGLCFRGCNFEDLGTSRLLMAHA